MNEIAVNPDPMKDFQDKLQARVRDDIRELLPQDAVAGLVKKAVEDVFFTPRKEKEPGWNGREITRPSWFVEAVTEAAKPIIKEAVEQFVAKHPLKVEQVLKDFLDENKLAVATAKYTNELLAAMIGSLQQAMSQHR